MLHILIRPDHAVQLDLDVDGTAAAHASLVYTRCAKGDEPASSPANRKVRILRARTLGADDNDKYSARHRGNNPFDMLAIYFGLVFLACTWHLAQRAERPHIAASPPPSPQTRTHTRIRTLGRHQGCRCRWAHSEQDSGPSRLRSFYS